MALGAKVNVAVLPDCCSRLASTCPRSQGRRPGKSERRKGVAEKEEALRRAQGAYGRDERERWDRLSRPSGGVAMFTCTKCGRKFDDEGDYAVHAQTCKG